MVLGKHGDYLESWREERRNVTQSQGDKKYPTYKKTKEGYLNWTYIA
jgi:hypothetical protein